MSTPSVIFLKVAKLCKSRLVTIQICTFKSNNNKVTFNANKNKDFREILNLLDTVNNDLFKNGAMTSTNIDSILKMLAPLVLRVIYTSLGKAAMFTTLSTINNILTSNTETIGKIIIPVISGASGTLENTHLLIKLKEKATKIIGGNLLKMKENVGIVSATIKVSMRVKLSTITETCGMDGVITTNTTVITIDMNKVIPVTVSTKFKVKIAIFTTEGTICPPIETIYLTINIVTILDGVICLAIVLTSNGTMTNLTTTINVKPYAKTEMEEIINVEIATGLTINSTPTRVINNIGQTNGVDPSIKQDVAGRVDLDLALPLLLLNRTKT